MYQGVRLTVEHKLSNVFRRLKEIKAELHQDYDNLICGEIEDYCSWISEEALALCQDPSDQAHGPTSYTAEEPIKEEDVFPTQEELLQAKRILMKTSRIYLRLVEGNIYDATPEALAQRVTNTQAILDTTATILHIDGLME